MLALPCIVMQSNLCSTECDARCAAGKGSHCAGADGERSQTVSKLWELLRRMLSTLPGKSSSAAARTQALIQGARAYLAKGHEDYVMRMVQSNRAQVRWTCHVRSFSEGGNAP